jgi:hypothetical protein
MLTADQLGCAVDLLKRMPPKDISENLEATLELAPDIIEDLLASVDQPLKEMLDSSCNRTFLICDYNRCASIICLRSQSSYCYYFLCYCPTTLVS